MALLSLLFFWAAAAGYFAYHRNQALEDRYVRVQRLCDAVARLERSRASAARIAAFDGDAAGEERHRRVDPLLEAAVAELIRSVDDPDAGPYVASVSATRTALLAVENRVFDLVRVARLELARDTLFSAEYELLRRAHADALFELARQVEARLADAERRKHRAATRTVLVGGALFAALLAVWAVAAARRTRELQREVAERRRMEDELRESEERWSFALEGAGDGVWDWDVQERTVSFSRQWKAMLGYAEHELGDSPEAWKALLHPDEREAVYERLRAHVEGRTPVYESEHRMRCRDGTFRWVLARGQVMVRTADGRPRRMIGTHTDISARKVAEQWIAEREEDLRSILRTTRDGFWLLDARGGFLDVNDAACAMLGYEREELLRLRVFEIEAAESREEAAAHLARIVTHGADRFETRMRRRDGALIEVEASVTYMDRGGGRFVCFCRDIGERKRIESALRESEERFRQIAETSHEVFWMTSADWTRILYVSPAYETIWGRACDELYRDPLTWLEAIHPEDRERVMAAAEAHYADHPSGIEYRILRPDGTLRWVRDRGFLARDPQGQLTRVVGIAEDVTPRKEAEAAREAIEIQLRHAQKLESIGRLAAGIAHEINTPIQYVGDNTRFVHQAFAHLRPLLEATRALVERATADGYAVDELREAAAALAAADLDFVLGEVPQALEQSLDGVGRVARIVQAMKEFSHPGSETKLPVDLNRAIESTITVARNEWKYVADLETDFDPALPPVPCLPGELNQVVLNVLINAAHAIGDVVGDGSDSKGRITVRTRHDGDWVEVRVADTGAGIPPEVQPKVFDPFFTTKAVGKGSGQGLAIARSVVVDKHGGSIAFETEPGRGTTFVIRLPLAVAEVAASAG